MNRSQLIELRCLDGRHIATGILISPVQSVRIRCKWWNYSRNGAIGGSGNYHTTRVSYFAYQPVGLDRVVEPRLSPTLLDAAADRSLIYSLSFSVKQWELTARFLQSRLEPITLGFGRSTVSLATCRTRM